MRFRINLVAGALMLISAAIVNGQTRLDVNGTWKMNPAKSHFTGNGPTSITIKFIQKDSSLIETLNLSGQAGDRSFDLKYTTDGKEGDNQIGPQAVKTSAVWEKDALVIEWRADGSIFRRRITLSGDGKVMTIAVHHAEPNGETADDTVVLEKQ
jgi:hypothetical protein